MIDNSNSMEPKQAVAAGSTSRTSSSRSRTSPPPPDLHIGIITLGRGRGRSSRRPRATPSAATRASCRTRPRATTCGTAQPQRHGRPLPHLRPRLLRAARRRRTSSATSRTPSPATPRSAPAAAASSTSSPRCAPRSTACEQRGRLQAARRTRASCAPDAYLAVVILTDEDDCSAPPDSTLFDPTQTDARLGARAAHLVPLLRVRRPVRRRRTRAAAGGPARGLHAGHVRAGPAGPPAHPHRGPGRVPQVREAGSRGW